MESGNNKTFDAEGWEAHISQWKEETATGADSVPQVASADSTSRRRFLRATVAAGAVVTGVAAAGGVVYAAQRPQVLKSVVAGNTIPSGHCLEIVEGVKGSVQNPNQHIQVSTADFQAYVGTISGTTFTILHGHAVLVDKNGHNPNLTTCIKSAAYQAGGTTSVSLFVDPGVTTTAEYPAKSCLYVSQTLGTC